MPTPVAAARQCLTQESASVLDEAVAVARRRGHAQTTSLHMVSSLLSLPTSSLRDACTRTRNNAYSTRVQFKALELSLSVSLDRLPSSQTTKVDEPPVSNSLMAAIKRSQANQRRQPENFSFYQQQQQQYSSCSSVPLVKVELQNLIVSILDDPLVSRVFGEAGFRSCDIKMATLRPGNSFHPSQLFGYTSRYKRPSPPLFLCNLSASENSCSDVGSNNNNNNNNKCFSFPFMGCFSGDEESRKIGEVMLREKKRCPLLLGVSAIDSLRSFLESVRNKISGVLPDRLTGLCVVCVKDEILRYFNGDCDERTLGLRFEEAERAAESGGGVVVSFGDLGALVGEDIAVDRLRFLVGNLGRLVDLYGGKLWLIGTATTYEVYFKILNRFPSIEEDWHLGVLPVTSFKFSMGGSYPRSSSFVPLGGFFSMPPETKSPLSNAYQYVARCHLCNEKYEQEVAAVSNGGLDASVAEKHQSSSPSWLQTVEAGAQTGLSTIKGTDDRLLLNAKIMGLQKKWDSICQQHHFGRAYSHQFSNEAPRILGFQVGKGKMSNECSYNSNESSNEQGNKNASSSLSTDIQKNSSLKELSSWEMPSKDNSQSIVSKSGEALEFKSPNLESLSVNDDRTSPTSVTSVTTDLGLGLVSASTTTSREAEKPVDHVQQTSLCIHRDDQVHSDIVKDPKLLYKSLIERVGNHQEEAVSSIVETITQCHTKGSDQVMMTSYRRNIWINVRGGDRLSKKKLGLALAEVLYRSRESLIYVDLSFEYEITHIDALFSSQITNKYDLTMRGTVVDYLVEKLSKKPCVVFLENIDKADLVVQNTLFQAVKSGRFTDFCGREVNVSNCIFLGATRFLEANKSTSCVDEEDIESTKGSSLQIVIRFDLSDDHDTMAENSMNKRKLIGQGTSPDQCRRPETTKRAHKVSNSNSNSYLDLNLPAEVSEICNAIHVESDSDSSSESSRSWLEDLDKQVDQTVVFKKFDFSTLAEKLFKSVAECLHDAVGSKCSVEIEAKAMQQIVAAAYLYGNKIVEDWIEQVLRQGFVEAMGKFSLGARSIVRLIVCDDAVREEQHQGLLPARVTMK